MAAAPVRTLALALALMLAGLLTGCKADDPSPSPEKSAVTRSVGSLTAFCEIQGLREMIAAGDVSRSQLPDWVDMTEVEGTPRVVDFRQKPTESHAAVLDRLFNSPGLKDVHVPRRLRTPCFESTEDDVVRSQNGHGYLWYEEHGSEPPKP